ncbi:DsrE family protein [Flavobacterium sp. MFBS3-15]|uniref:DsrE family protein n=1 Tax=Flavobacterium sp. MFBS3-15 TaxID=2989816 RepID=UPI0022355C88|nr:DsrE family protein [Flavobacterium sp. MFBS3-15]MCW4468906.1 DsrE family protein [Flavobacterium sp. MFBS3-15]
MKKLTVILLSLMASLFPAQLSAQELTVAEVENAIKADGKYAMLVRNAEHLQASVKTAAALIKDNPGLDFRIVVCGPIVKEVAGDAATRELMDRAKKEGVIILACGISMKKFNIAAADLPRTVQVTENGLLYIFGLQENGYKTITL